MREMSWPETGPRADRTIECGELRIRFSALGGGVLISGDLGAALAVLAPEAPMLGMGAACTAPPYAIRIARDRALLVTDTPMPATAGWHDPGFAASAADDQWTLVGIVGAEARAVIDQGTAVDPDGGSPSAALRFAGLTCLLLRQQDGYALFVETPQVWFVEEWLRAAVADPAC